MPPLQVVMSFIGIIIILFGAYYATYYIGLKASGQERGKNRGRNRSIKLLERFAISKDKSFCIVEIAGKVYIVGVSNQSMTLLDTLEAEEYAMVSTGDGETSAGNAMQGGPFSSGFLSFVVSFMGQGHGRKRKAFTKKNDSHGTFADSMKSVQEKQNSGQQGRENDTRTESSQEE